MFERVRVEVYFPLIGPVIFLPCTTEKRETSANNLALEDKSSDKSLIYTKESSGPRIDP